MELSDRIKRPKGRMEANTAPPDRGAGAPGGAASPAEEEAAESFDRWLDGQLQALYRTVLNEPLPREILDLLSRPKGGSRG